MSFYVSGMSNSYHLYPSITPTIFPSAPPLEEIENEPFFSTSLHSQQPTPLSYDLLYSQSMISIPTHKIFWTKENEDANQAYLNLWQDLHVLENLPTLTLDDKSIQTLKHIEERSDRGVVNALLVLTIKIMQAVSKLSLGFVVAGSILLIASTLLGLPATAIFMSLFIASPVMTGCVLSGIACKIVAYVAEHLKKNWIEYSFRSTIFEDKKQLKQIEDLRAWIRLDQLSDIEVRIHETIAKIQTTQQTLSYISVQSSQIIYLQSLLDKIEQFHEIEDKLDIQFSAPLLNHFLSTD